MRHSIVAVLLMLAGCSQSLVRFDAGGSPGCDAGTSCSGACVDTRLDDANCGACGNACDAASSCAAGVCRADNCAGADCSAIQICEGGACLEIRCVGVGCPGGQTCSRGLCVAESCGVTACLAGSVCVGGACTDVECVGVTCRGAQVCRLGRCEDVVDAGCVGLSDAGLGGDVDHCGQCQRSCPVPANAERQCRQGQCGRGPCRAGFFDFDPALFGCETSCVGVRCTSPDGGFIDLTNPAIPETGQAWQTASSGASYGSAVQTSATHTHFGTLGQPTPGGTVEQTSATQKNVGGFESMLKQ